MELDEEIAAFKGPGFGGTWLGFDTLQGEKIVKAFYYGGLILIGLGLLVSFWQALAFSYYFDALEQYGEAPYDWGERISFMTFFVTLMGSVWSALVLRLVSEVLIVFFKGYEQLRRLTSALTSE